MLSCGDRMQHCLLEFSLSTFCFLSFCPVFRCTSVLFLELPPPGRLSCKMGHATGTTAPLCCLTARYEWVSSDASYLRSPFHQQLVVSYDGHSFVSFRDLKLRCASRPSARAAPLPVPETKRRTGQDRPKVWTVLNEVK